MSTPSNPPTTVPNTLRPWSCVDAIETSSPLRAAGRRGEAAMRLNLLGAFELFVNGRALRLPVSAQRLVAFLALQERPVRRLFVAGSLWTDASENRAAASLRSALWRTQAHGRLIETTSDQLRLASAVHVDLHRADAVAARELAHEPCTDLDVDIGLLVRDLLPDWYEDWAVLERERFRQRRLSALDALCERFVRAGHVGRALDVGLRSLAGDPLRESAHRAVVRAHLADGNVSEALRQYRLCKQLLHEQLGVEPSERMEELVRGREEVPGVLRAG